MGRSYKRPSERDYRGPNRRPAQAYLQILAAWKNALAEQPHDLLARSRWRRCQKLSPELGGFPANRAMDAIGSKLQERGMGSDIGKGAISSMVSGLARRHAMPNKRIQTKPEGAAS